MVGVVGDSRWLCNMGISKLLLFPFKKLFFYKVKHSLFIKFWVFRINIVAQYVDIKCERTRSFGNFFHMNRYCLVDKSVIGHYFISIFGFREIFIFPKQHWLWFGSLAFRSPTLSHISKISMKYLSFFAFVWHQTQGWRKGVLWHGISKISFSVRNSVSPRVKTNVVIPRKYSF